MTKQYLRARLEIENNQLCYCFDINAAQYSAALLANEAEAIKNFVNQQTQTGACACETRNPSGRCCLADFKQLESTFHALPVP